MWMVASYRRTHRPSRWLGLRVGSHLALSLHSTNEPGDLSQWPRHDNSTIDIIIGISIRITVDRVVKQPPSHPIV